MGPFRQWRRRSGRRRDGQRGGWTDGRTRRDVANNCRPWQRGQHRRRRRRRLQSGRHRSGRRRRGEEGKRAAAAAAAAAAASSPSPTSSLNLCRWAAFPTSYRERSLFHSCDGCTAATCTSHSSLSLDQERTNEGKVRSHYCCSTPGASLRAKADDSAGLQNPFPLKETKSERLTRVLTMFSKHLDPPLPDARTRRRGRRRTVRNAFPSQLEWCF